MSDFDYRSLDDLIHSRIRLAAMAILASVEHAEFTYLRDAMGVTDGNLSTHLARLVDARYIAVEKRFVANRPMSRYRLTHEGRRAFRTYLDCMDRLLGGIER